MLNKEQLQEFEKEGFLVIKNVLSKEELTKLREITTDFFTNKEDQVAFIQSGKTKPNAINSIPELAFIFKNPKVLEIMKDLCGDVIKYGHHSDIHYNMLSGWHKDNYGDDDWAVTDNGETYKCYKIAFYLQDHTNNKEGLTVRRGSHKYKNLNQGEIYDIPSEAGDAVVFDMRISHIGKKTTFPHKVVKFFIRDNKQRYKLFQNLRKTFNVADKISVFVAFGVPNYFTDQHISRNIERQNKQNKATKKYIIDAQVAEVLDEVHIDYKL